MLPRHGERHVPKRSQRIRLRARHAASRCLSAGVGTARRAYRKHAVSADCEQSKRLAKRSQRRQPRARTRVRARRLDASVAKPMPSIICAIIAGLASSKATSAIGHGSSARLCRSCKAIRSTRSRGLRAYRSRLARAFGPVRRCLIRGIGTACSHWSKLGNEAARRTFLAADAFLRREQGR